MTGKPVEHDRYHAAGLERNPFSIEVQDSDSGVIDNSWFVDRGVPDPPPPGSSTLVQIVGDQGVGKSTHLHHWRAANPGPYHYIPRQPYSERWTRGPLGTLVYGDEIDRMPRPLRTRWFKQLAKLGATVVIGTHRDLGGLGRRVGLTVRTHLLGQADRDELVEVLTKRIAAVALPGAAGAFGFSDAEIDRILAESGGNLRAADSVSHRLVAQRVAGRVVTER